MKLNESDKKPASVATQTVSGAGNRYIHDAAGDEPPVQLGAAVLTPQESADADASGNVGDAQVQEIERPLSMESGGSGGWLKKVVIAVIVLGVVGFGGWKAMDDEQRQQLAQSVLSRTQGTPLEQVCADLVKRLLPGLEGSPASVASEPRESAPTGDVSFDSGRIHTDENTLSGRQVRADIGSAQGEHAPQKAAETTETAEPAPAADPEAPIPPVAVDERVRPAFVQDLASWVVRQYQPGSHGGSLAVSVQSLNRRYGSKMTGLDGGSNESAARASILRYAFNPGMIKGLYSIYADSFLDAVAIAASRYDPAQLNGLYTALAGRCRLLATGLESVSAVPDLPQRVRALEESEKAVTETVHRMNEARIAYNQQVELRSSPDAIARAEADLNDAAARFRAVSDNDKALQQRLADDIRARGARRFDDETALYLARWVGRRHQADSRAMESVHVAAATLRDLAGRCDVAAVDGPPAARHASAPEESPVAPIPANAVPADASPSLSVPGAPAVPGVVPGDAAPSLSAPAVPEVPVTEPTVPAGKDAATPAALPVGPVESPTDAAPEAELPASKPVPPAREPVTPPAAQPADQGQTPPVIEAPTSGDAPEAVPQTLPELNPGAPDAPVKLPAEPVAPVVPVVPDPAPDVKAEPVALGQLTSLP